jgi:CheY-like chemotaxis protein
VVGEAENGEQAARLAVSGEADIALLDIETPRMNGPTAAELMRFVRPQARVIRSAEAVVVFNAEQSVSFYSAAAAKLLRLPLPAEPMTLAEMRLQHPLFVYQVKRMVVRQGPSCMSQRRGVSGVEERDGLHPVGAQPFARQELGQLSHRARSEIAAASGLPTDAVSTRGVRLVLSRRRCFHGRQCAPSRPIGSTENRRRRDV